MVEDAGVDFGRQGERNINTRLRAPFREVSPVSNSSSLTFHKFFDLRPAQELSFPHIELPRSVTSMP
jgi:hypothetical protein